MKRACLLPLLAGCTQWTTTPIYGQQTEVARRLLGAPQIETTTSSEGAASFGTAGESWQGRHYGTGYHVGGISGSTDSSTRSHCVQQAQIDYVQPVDYVTHSEHRAFDVAGSALLGLAGIAVVGVASAQYNNSESFYEMNPSFFAKPSEPTVAYGIGGVALVGAVAWIVYSLVGLPRGAPPVEPSTTHAWTDTTYVEATGCGLVPADR